jgi:hypothetical protein
MYSASRLLPALCLVLMLVGCSSLAPVPQGSQPQGTYQGLVWGAVDGRIQVQLFLTPAGDQVFSGHFVDSGNGAVSEIRGTLLGNTLDGKIGLLLGTITGQLSADGSQMTGEMKFAQYHLAWNASLQ